MRDTNLMGRRPHLAERHLPAGRRSGCRAAKSVGESAGLLVVFLLIAGCADKAPDATIQGLGEPCVNDAACVPPLVCDRSQWDGFCTKACMQEADCGPNGTCQQAHCRPTCALDADCGRPGYLCVAAVPKYCRQSCGDGARNADETDVDCGGKQCFGCKVGDKCKVAADCLLKACMGGVCNPNCADRVLNGDETDTDCGGKCPPCRDAFMCKVDADCAAGGCVAGACHLLARCQDGKLNDDEVDVDCGGKKCLRCGDGKKCKLGDGCLSGKCVNGICGKSTCMCKSGGTFCDLNGRCRCDARSCDSCCNGDLDDVTCGEIFVRGDLYSGRYGERCSSCGPIAYAWRNGICRPLCYVAQTGHGECQTGCCQAFWCFPGNTTERCGGGADCQACRQPTTCQAGVCK